MKNISKQRLYKFLIGVAVWVAAFLYNRFVSTENAVFILVNGFLTLILIGVGFALICATLSPSKNQKKPPHKNGSEVIKEWTVDEFFSFLQKEKEMLDIIIENDGQLHIGITTDYERKQFFTNKSYSIYYYIEEDVFDDFETFKSTFLSIFKKEVVSIYYAGIEDMPVKI